MPVPGHPVPGPDRAGQGTMDDAVEASAQRVRHHLRRPLPGRRDLLTKTAGNTVSEIVPQVVVLERRCSFRLRGCRVWWWQSCLYLQSFEEG